MNRHKKIRQQIKKLKEEKKRELDLKIEMALNGIKKAGMFLKAVEGQDSK